MGFVYILLLKMPRPLTEVQCIKQEFLFLLEYISIIETIEIYRGYSMLFDEYEIYVTSETGFLIFLRVK